jgi:ribosomal-protein-alanine N-acetyltransferase
MKRRAERQIAKAPPRAVQVGPTVYLRYPTSRDRDEFMALKLASRRFLEPWEATPTDGTDMFSAAAFDRLLKTRRNSLNHRFLICPRTGDHRGQIVGQISLSSIIRGPFQSCFVGYWIGAAHIRRGYATEALRLALDFAFRTLKLHRVEANIVPRNRASKALVKKLRFRYEGTSKRYLRIAGKWADHEHWALTVEEWNAHRRLRRPARRPLPS